MKNFLSVIIACSLSLSVFSQSDVYLKINHLLDSSPFTFNTNSSNNINNTFNIDRLEYYISSIAITHDGGTITNITNTWILANASTQVYELLGNYSITTIEKVTFSIGVETPINHDDPSLLPMLHPLAPKSPSMHWGWNAGYRFIAMEGMAGTTTPNQNFELHGLGDVNYFSQTIITAGTTDANGLVIELNADYKKALEDVNVASGVISHGEINEAKKVIKNFKNHVFTSIEGNSPVSIKEVVNEGNFKLYPNPASSDNKISYEYSGELKNVILEITDLSGRLIQKQQMENSNKVIFNKLDQGLYLVNLKSVSGEIVKTNKLIVNK